MTAAPAERLLVVTLSNIGDLVLTTPVLEAVSAMHPGTAIDILGDQRSLELLADAPYAGELFVRHKRAGWRTQLDLIRRLRRRRYRLVIDLRTPIIPYLLRAERRLSKRRRRRGATCHAAEEHYAVLQPLAPPPMPPPARLYIGATVQAEADACLRTLSGDAWLAVAPGANWPGKKWPRERFRALLEAASAHFDGAIILGSAQDATDAEALRDVGLPLVMSAGRTSLRGAAALIARARAFVGNDSGLGHVAAALAVPSLTLFGPGDPARYRPWGARARILVAPGRDLARLSAAAVYDELVAMVVSNGGSAQCG